MAIKKEKFTLLTQVRPDSKGRVTLSKLTEGVSSFNVSRDTEGRILLEPMVEIPAREKWLFDNPEALANVRRGLADAKAGRLVSRPSFDKYTKEDDED
jgi:predicted transcriptional regulator